MGESLQNQENRTENLSSGKEKSLAEISVIKSAETLGKKRFLDKEEKISESSTVKNKNKILSAKQSHAEYKDIERELYDCVEIINAQEIFTKFSREYIQIIRALSELEKFVINSNKRFQIGLEEHSKSKSKFDWFYKYPEVESFKQKCWLEWGNLPDLGEDIKSILNNRLYERALNFSDQKLEILKQDYRMEVFLKHALKIENKYRNEINNLSAILSDANENSIRADEFIFWCLFLRLDNYLDMAMSTCIVFKFRNGFRLEKANPIFRLEKKYLMTRFPNSDSIFQRLDQLMKNVEAAKKSKEIINLALYPKTAACRLALSPDVSDYINNKELYENTLVDEEMIKAIKII